MKKIFFGSMILYWLTTGLSGYSQTPSMLPSPPVNVQSPNVATLGLFGDITVSYYTGVPEISVSLYTIKSKSITMPLSLNYHASGFRPDMHPDWLGMGWNLNAWGAISANVKDMPEDYDNPNYSIGGNAGFYFNHSILNTTNWNQTAYMKSIAEGNNSLKYTEPGEFSFNFNRYSGRFLLNPEGNWKVKCTKPVKVSFNGTFLNVSFQALSGSRAAQYGFTKSFSFIPS